MGLKIFLTGATGYIGGDALYALVSAHPEYEVTALVRNSDKGRLVASEYSKVRLVYGDLDSIELLEEESKKADVVLHAAHADHQAAASAIIKGITQRPEGSPGYLLHTSGTGILIVEDLKDRTFGQGFRDKVYDDWDNIAEVTSLPDFAPHRLVDEIVLAAGESNPSAIKTAIVCPPTIYGIGRGPDNKTSQQVPKLITGTLQRKTGFKINTGETYWPNVHVHDLSTFWVQLVEAAASGGGKASWGRDGYYFTENGEHIWGTISNLVAATAHEQGLIPSKEVISVTAEEADKISPHGGFFWGSNSRCRAIRARKLLGWNPVSPTIEAEMPEAVRVEARRLGITTGHAAKVTS